jgi:hypothetical protein
MLEIATREKLSVKEVETVFLRRQAIALGFQCDHSIIGYAKGNGKPYCKGCWTRLEQKKPPSYIGRKMVAPGRFVILKTFLDRPKLKCKPKPESELEPQPEPRNVKPIIYEE